MKICFLKITNEINYLKGNETFKFFIKRKNNLNNLFIFCLKKNHKRSKKKKRLMIVI